MKRLLTIVFLLFSASAFSGEPNAWDAWAPAGWKLLSSSQGDLDGDKQDDVALVLEEDNPLNIKTNDGYGPDLLNVNPRRLIVLFKTPEGYRQVLSRDGFLPSEHSEETPCLADPLMEGGVRIEGGLLTIELRMWLSCGGYGVTNSEQKFRYENKRFRLIGHEYFEFSRSTGKETNCSVNYLTGKRAITRGGNMFSEEESKPKTIWKPLWKSPSQKRAIYLDDETSYGGVDDYDAEDGWCC